MCCRLEILQGHDDLLLGQSRREWALHNLDLDARQQARRRMNTAVETDCKPLGAVIHDDEAGVRLLHEPVAPRLGWISLE